MEKGVFPHLHSITDNHDHDLDHKKNKLLVNSFQFCILTTHLNTNTDTDLNTIQEDKEAEDHLASSDSMEIFHFQLIQSREEQTIANTHSLGSTTNIKPLVEQLRGALQNVIGCLEDTKCCKKGIAIVSVNVIMKFQTEASLMGGCGRDHDGNGNGDGDGVVGALVEGSLAGGGGDGFRSQALRPEFFSEIDAVHPLGILQRRSAYGSKGENIDCRGHSDGDNDSDIDYSNANDNDNDIVEMEMGADGELDQDGEGTCARSKSSTQRGSQSKLFLPGVEQLAQTSQSQDSRGHCWREEGRREIARVLLPHHSVVIGREYRVVDREVRHQEEELETLFPHHRAQVRATMMTMMNDGKDGNIEIDAGRGIGGTGREKMSRENDHSSPIGTTRKRKRATPPLTPMRVCNNRDMGRKIHSSSSHRLKTKLIEPNHSTIRISSTAANGNDPEREQERTPVNACRQNRVVERSQLSPMRSTALFITPKCGSGKKCSPRSGSPSEAPTLVEPLSSGKKSCVNGSYFSSMSSIPRTNNLHF